MFDILSHAFDVAMYVVNPVIGTVWHFVGDKIEDALNIEEHINTILFFFEVILPVIHRYTLQLIFDKSVEICNTSGHMVVGYLESNFPNMGDLNLLYFLFGFIIFVFVIKLVVHIVSGLMNIL